MGIVATRKDKELLAAIDELAEYLGEDTVATAVNVGNSFYLVAEEWEQRKPKTPEEIHAYYRESKAYLWNLVISNYAIPHQVTWRRIAPALCPKGGSVIDVGGGIGSTLLGFEHAGRRVHCDVGGTLMGYAEWRYANANMPVEMFEWPAHYSFVDAFPENVRGPHDLVICTEVIEHVPDPVKLAATLAAMVKPGGKLLATVSFDDDHGLFPCHLNQDKYTNEYFETVVFSNLGLRRVDEWTYEKTV